MKKRKASFSEKDSYWIKKTLLIMKITTLLLIVNFIYASATTFSQNMIVTLKLHESSAKEVFKAIESQTAYKFLYRDTDVKDIRVNLDAKAIPVSTVLDETLKNSNVTYRMLDNGLIVIATKDELYQQQTKISGKITDASTGDPIPGANIVIKGTTKGTISDVNGAYSLDVPDTNAVLVFSFVGYQSQEIHYSGQTQINVSLSLSSQQLNQVVVIGYGTQRKADVTSAVASVKSNDFIQGDVKDAGQLIAGKVAGLTISDPSGDPTSQTQILLRGRSTLLGANLNPLILVDGVPGDLKTVAPEDIASVTVLKDGSAAAIYGTRGTNGVILITTRRASGNNKTTVEYSTYVSTQTITRKPDFSNAADYRKQIAEGFRDPSWDKGYSTDWLKQITRIPVSNEHNLTIRGGNQVTNYLVNVNYNNAQGIFLKSNNSTFTGRFDFNHSMFNNKVKINVDMLGSSNKYTTTGDGYSFNGYTYRQALIQNPTAPVKDSLGNWYQQTSLFEYENPVSRLNENTGENDAHTNRFKSSVSYEPIKSLKLKGVFSYNTWNQNRGYAETKKSISTIRDGRNGYASVGASKSIDRLVELTAEYDKKIGNNSFVLLAGYSYQDNTNTNFWMQNWDFPTDLFGYSDIGIGNALKDGLAPEYSYKAKTNLIGIFGRLTYNYKDKYLLMGSIRREAASQLYGTKEPWGNFPAISVGWRITNEPFMSGQSLFDNLKLRVGYGVTGTEPSDLFLGVGLLNYDRYVYSNGTWLQTLIPSQNPNPSLRWEEKHETNVGLDFAMLNNRIYGNVDVYKRKIDGLLFDYAVPSPPNLYTTTRANVGVMDNKGVEVMLNFVPVKSKDFEWTSSVSFSTNSGKLVSLSNDLYKASSDYFTTGYTGPPVQTFTHIVKVGEPIGNFYGFKVIGIGHDSSDMANYGQWVYEGPNGDTVKYTDFGHSFEDKRVIGNGLPKYYAGWNNTFRYKNWDLSITQRGAFKFQIANLTRMMYENPTFTQYNLLRSAFDKVYGQAYLKSPQEFNSYYIENGDYWKIDNITLGYTFRKTGMKIIQSARIYVSTLNTLIITKYKGVDPEVTLLNSATTAQAGLNVNDAPALAPGVDNRDKYPTTRSYTIGLNVTF